MQNIRILSFLVIIILVLMIQSCGAQNNIETSIENSTTSMQTTAEGNESVENLDYFIDTWSSPVTKEEAMQLTSILDFWNEEYKARYMQDDFREIWVVNLKDHHDWTVDVSEIEPGNKATGPTEKFTEEQLALIAHADLSDHLRFSARFKNTKIETGEVEENVLVSQTRSVVPEVQATYQGGFDTLIGYVKEASRDQVKHIKREEAGRCRIFFTVKKNGSIDGIKMVEESNYPDVDVALIRILRDMLLKWTPARNEKGERVDQEFVFTFGMAGC